VELSPSNLIFHELIGLVTEVVDSTNPNMIDIRGKVVDETRNTLIVETESNREKMVPKADTTFVFHLPVRSADKYTIKHVRVNGTLLLSQPENRIKNIRKYS
jgi:ribonuclease P protein subunit POP4